MADGDQTTNGSRRLALSAVLGRVTSPASAQLENALVHAGGMIRRIWSDGAIDQATERFRVLLDDLRDSEIECLALRQRIQSLNEDKANLGIACRELEAGCLRARDELATAQRQAEAALEAERARHDMVEAQLSQSRRETQQRAAEVAELCARVETGAAEIASLRAEIQRLQRENTMLLAHLGRLSLEPEPNLRRRLVAAGVRALRGHSARQALGRMARDIALLGSRASYVSRPSGERATVEARALNGFLEHAEIDDGVLRLKGWAVDARGQEPCEIILVAGERAIAAGVPVLPRPDVAEAKHLDRIPLAGFVLSVDSGSLEGISRNDLRIFAVSRDGVASELAQLCDLP